MIILPMFIFLPSSAEENGEDASSAESGEENGNPDSLPTPETCSPNGSESASTAAPSQSEVVVEVVSKKDKNANHKENAIERMEASEALNDARRSSIDLQRPPVKLLVSLESYPLRIALELLKIDRIKEIKGVDSKSLHLAKDHFKKTKILYIFPDRASVEAYTQKNKCNTFAPKWFEPEKYFQYTRNEYNTIVVSEEGIDLIIDFIGINCQSLEVIYSEVTLPFVHFAARLGPKMCFFRGFDVSLRWRDYGTLSQFSKLQFMRGYGAPCYYQRLIHNLPVTVIDDFGLSIANKCGGCIKRVFQISRDLGMQVGRIRRGIPLPTTFNWLNPHPEINSEETIDPSFASKIKELTLLHYHQGQSFYFPNLVSLSLRSPRHSVYFKSIEYSVKLRSLELTLALNDKCLIKLGKLVARLPQLNLFFLFNYVVEGNTFPSPKSQETFLTNLVTSCQSLENLIVPFIISITSVKQLIRLRNLIFLGVERFPMDSSIGFFANTRGNRIDRITITENKEAADTFDGTNIVHSAFIKCFENHRYNQVNINYIDTCQDEGCPLKKFINTISSSVKLTYEPE